MSIKKHTFFVFKSMINLRTIITSLYSQLNIKLLSFSIKYFILLLIYFLCINKTQLALKLYFSTPLAINQRVSANSVGSWAPSVVRQPGIGSKCFESATTAIKRINPASGEPTTLDLSVTATSAATFSNEQFSWATKTATSLFECVPAERAFASDSNALVAQPEPAPAIAKLSPPAHSVHISPNSHSTAPAPSWTVTVRSSTFHSQHATAGPVPTRSTKHGASVSASRPASSARSHLFAISADKRSGTCCPTATTAAAAKCRQCNLKLYFLYKLGRWCCVLLELLKKY